MKTLIVLVAILGSVNAQAQIMRQLNAGMQGNNQMDWSPNPLHPQPMNLQLEQQAYKPAPQQINAGVTRCHMDEDMNVTCSTN